MKNIHQPAINSTLIREKRKKKVAQATRRVYFFHFLLCKGRKQKKTNFQRNSESWLLSLSHSLTKRKPKKINIKCWNYTQRALLCSKIWTFVEWTKLTVPPNCVSSTYKNRLGFSSHSDRVCLLTITLERARRVPLHYTTRLYDSTATASQCERSERLRMTAMREHEVDSNTSKGCFDRWLSWEKYFLESPFSHRFAADTPSKT